MTPSKRLVHVSCPHGFFPDGTRRWKLTQQRIVGGTIETIFGGQANLSLDEAVRQIEGRRVFSHEHERGLWSLKPIHGQARATVADQFKPLVEWQGPWQTAPFCGQCAIERTKQANG